MNSNCIFAKALPVLDGKFFTVERFVEWYNLLLEFAGESINLLREETGNIKDISYEVNTVLLQEVVYDAMVGLKTIVVSENNEVDEPNPFKIASYLGYWFLRHKPIIFRVKPGLDIDKVVFARDIDEADRESIIVEMKHMNEVAISRFLLRYIFKVECARPTCTKRQFKKVKATGCVCFDSFPNMLLAIFEKLKYHLTYRDISPRIIEHFLEAYTLHPYVPYTCDLWNTEENEQ